MKPSLYLRALYQARQWIDARVPREFLMIQVTSDSNVIMHASHLELMARIKMHETAHLVVRSPHNVVCVQFAIGTGYPS